MSQLLRLSETIATYRKHGWQLRRVLLRPETRAAAAASMQETPLEGAAVEESEVDATLMNYLARWRRRQTKWSARGVSLVYTS